MTRNGFTIVEAVLATTLAAAALVMLLLVRQNCLKQIERAEELNTATSTAQRIINNWRSLDNTRQEQVPLAGAIEKVGISWICEVKNVEVLPAHWMPALTVQFFSKTHGDKEPIASFAGVKYPQEPEEGLAYE